MDTRCVFCAANLPHARHMSALEASKLDIVIREGRLCDCCGVGVSYTADDDRECPYCSVDFNACCYDEPSDGCRRCAGTPRADKHASVTIVTPQPAPEAPQE